MNTTSVRAVGREAAFRARVWFDVIAGATILAIVAAFLGFGLLHVGAQATRHAGHGDAVPKRAAPTAGVAYLTRVGGEPLALPCARSIRIDYDSSGAPYDAGTLIATAAARVAAATGLHVDAREGRTSWDDATPMEPYAIGVMWTNSLAGETAADVGVLGEGGEVAASGYLVHGRVALAADVALPPTASAGGELSPLLHEIGHALNLGHVADRGAAMFPVDQPDRAPGFDHDEVAALRWIATANCQRATAADDLTPNSMEHT